jgi:hypothetical protein
VSSILCLGRFDQHAAKNLSSKMMTWVFAATHSPERWADRETGRSSSCARHARLAERAPSKKSFSSVNSPIFARPEWPRIRRDDDETSTPEPQPGIQGDSGIGCREGREDAGRMAGTTIRRSRQPDHAMEGAASASASASAMRSDVDGGCAGSSLFDAYALCSGEPNVFVGPSDPFRHQDSAIVRASSVLRHSTAQLYMLYW